MIDEALFKGPEKRAVPLFVLADTSGSMHGEKISSLNTALQNMLNLFKEVQSPMDQFELSIITFGGDNAEVTLPMTNIEEVELPALAAFGKTPMGNAFDLVSGMLQDENICPQNAKKPSLFLITDGIPTDKQPDMPPAQWQPLQTLLRLSQGAQRFAIGVGNDQNDKLLEEFIHSPNIPVWNTQDVSQIQAFFAWATQSTIMRTQGRIPFEQSIARPFNPLDKI